MELGLDRKLVRSIPQAARFWVPLTPYPQSKYFQHVLLRNDGLQLLQEYEEEEGGNVLC